MVLEWPDECFVPREVYLVDFACDYAYIILGPPSVVTARHTIADIVEESHVCRRHRIRVVEQEVDEHGHCRDRMSYVQGDDVTVRT